MSWISRLTYHCSIVAYRWESVPMRNFKTLCHLALASGCILLTWVNTGRADLTYSGSSGHLSASVVFSLSSQTLAVTLTNTSSHDVLSAGGVLTGVFFNTQHKLTPISA